MANVKNATKQCKFCRSVIDARANVCPVCKRTLSKGNGCLITLLVFVVLFIGLGFLSIPMVIKDLKANPPRNDDSIAAKHIDVTSEQSELIDSVLKSCGITEVKKIEHDELLDNAHADGETGYRIAVSNDIDNVILYLNSDKSVYSLRYADYDLYADNSTLATLQDYTFTTKELTNIQLQCEEKVKGILKSPSTAKFPSILEWGFSKEKNIIKVQSYVDSQNSFGAEIRSYFSFTLDTDANAFQSFVFDGQELLQ